MGRSSVFVLNCSLSLGWERARVRVFLAQPRAFLSKTTTDRIDLRHPRAQAYSDRFGSFGASLSTFDEAPSR